MVAFDPKADLSADVGYQLLQDGPFTLVRSPAVLTSLIEWLTKHGYDVRSVDTTSWTSATDLLRDIAAALDFPTYFGHNFNALDDCLFDVAHGDYGIDPTSAGLVFVLTHYDQFATIDQDSAHALLDYFASQARLGSLFGHRMICLVHSDDPQLSFPTIGSSHVGWNAREWPDVRRAL